MTTVPKGGHLHRPRKSHRATTGSALPWRGFLVRPVTRNGACLVEYSVVTDLTDPLAQAEWQQSS